MSLPLDEGGKISLNHRVDATASAVAEIAHDRARDGTVTGTFPPLCRGHHFPETVRPLASSPLRWGRFLHEGLVVVRIRVAKDVYAIVDDEDAARVSRISWRLRRSATTRYAYTSSKFIGKSQQLLHRFILGLRPGEICDHANGNGLDNRRSNLRVVTAAQNAQNCFAPRREAGKTSRFKGVAKVANGWLAQVNSGGIVDRVGVFATEEDAARAYDRAAVAAFGEFARTNEMMGLFAQPVDRRALEATGPKMPAPEALDPDLALAKLRRSRAQHRRGYRRMKEIEHAFGPSAA